MSRPMLSITLSSKDIEESENEKRERNGFQPNIGWNKANQKGETSGFQANLEWNKTIEVERKHDEAIR